MPRIEVVTYLNAPIERCFLLALNVEAHAASARQSQEQVVGEIRQGSLQLGDSVTFRARHFGVWQRLTSQITALQAPTYFRDEMQRGAFRRMWHEHHFESLGISTRMRDVFEYTSPLGWLGRVADWMVLERYLRRFLEQRGRVLKQVAETEAWQNYLPTS